MFGSKKGGDSDRHDPTRDSSRGPDLDPAFQDPQPTLAEEIRSGDLPPVDGRDQNAGGASAFGPSERTRDGSQVRHDGVGPTDYSDEPTRTFSAARGEDAVDVDRTAMMPATDAPVADDRYGDSRYGDSRYGDSQYGDAPQGDSRYDDSHYVSAARYDTRPEERFATGTPAAAGTAGAAAVDRNRDGVPDAAEDEGVAKHGFHIPKIGGWLLGLVRILIGWQFLWAFLDKTFGLGFGTPSDRAWINGGSPTQGYLTGAANDPNNPFQSVWQFFLDQAWSDWLFMAGLLGIGIVLMLGLGKVLTWVAALSGAVLLLMMYMAAWPAGHSRGAVGAEGQAATNPFLDDHLLNAILLLALAACNAAAYLGLAKAWRTRRAVRQD
ncbi:DoxX family protein [Blastococcus sp. Marseille-P5729]|uniref:DoxX family protein n=1 Tax=Blastococcus sp. Marseille-P5729 TaxID=2086582 RepID=UPI000D0F4A86|nr:DoxX family protein [Blastococcus sp. Marseille-P5729]